MSRGRKPIVFNGSDWETVFYNSVGKYVQIINAELSKEIKQEPLSKHIKILGGYAFKSTEYKKEGIPIIRISDFSNERVELSDPAFYTESKELERFVLKQGDIIIALTGGTIAKLAIIQEGLGKLYLNQRVGKFEVLNPNEFEAEYVYWIARSVQSIIKGLAWGAAIPNVSPKQIEELEFSFPDKSIQRKIIEFLNDLKNNKIDNKLYFNEEIENKIIDLHGNQISGSQITTELTHQLDLVKQLRQAFLREAMQGKLGPQDPNDEPASELLKKIKAKKEQLIKEKKIKKEKELPPIKPEEIPFEIPENWVWCRLGEVTRVKVGSTPSRDIAKYWNGDIPWVSSGEVANNFIFETKEQITKEGFENTSLIIYPAGSVLVAMIGQGKTRGQTSILKIDATTNQNVAGLVIRHKQLLSEYLWYFFLSRYEITRGGASGGNQPALNGIKISNTVFPLPPLSEQHRIVAKLEQLMRHCDELEQSIKQSQIQNEQLLQQVLREALRPKSDYKMKDELSLAAED